MSSPKTESDQLWRIETRAVGAGAAAGVLAGIGMGVVLQFGTEILPVLGAFAGRTSLVRGWIINLIISVLYGVFFVVVLAYPPIHSYMGDFDAFDYAFVGVVYGTFIVAGTVTLLPFVVELPWLPAAARSSFPNVFSPGLGGLVPAFVLGIGHLVYGAILGFVYGWIDR